MPTFDEFCVVQYTSQWFEAYVIFLNNFSWSAEQILGAPQVYPQYGDIAGAWAQKSLSNAEYIEVIIVTSG